MPGVDLNYFIRQANKLTEKIEQRKKELAEETVEGKAGEYTLEIRRGGDELSYLASAKAIRIEGVDFDARCAEMGLDQHGRRFARDESGEDSTGDCWDRK